jgi:high-affinity nickel permease
MWFNNCVGKRNYAAFMVSIASTFVFAVVVSIHVVVSSTSVQYGVLEQLGKIIPSWIAALLMGIFGFLLFNLIVLHIYLIVNGMTTYQFLQKRKKEEEEEKKQKE